MRKSFCAVLFVIMFSVVVSASAFAGENYPIQSIKGKLLSVKIVPPGSGKAIGSTLVLLEDKGHLFDGMDPLLRCLEGQVVEIFYQYSEKDGAHGPVIRYVTIYIKGQ